jgi:hypothetical protein
MSIEKHVESLQEAQNSYQYGHLLNLRPANDVAAYASTQ